LVYYSNPNKYGFEYPGFKYSRRFWREPPVNSPPKISRVQISRAQVEQVLIGHTYRSAAVVESFDNRSSGSLEWLGHSVALECRHDEFGDRSAKSL
jgi:hypothetical protein